MAFLPSVLLLPVALVAQPPVDYPALQCDAEAALAALKADFQAQRKAGKAPKDIRPDFAGALEGIRARQAAAKGELREALLVMEWTVAKRATREEEPAAGLLRALLKEVPPTSPAWQVSPNLTQSLEPILGPANAAYLKAMKEKGAPEVRAILIEAEVGDLLENGRVSEAGALVARLRRDFAGASATPRAAAALDKELKAGLYIGQPAPDFTVRSLHDASVTFSKSTFRGKYLLVDFWATWCGWCVKELPNTHTQYGKYQDRGLEILSFSADKSPEMVKEFQKKPGTPMPWKHAFLARGAEADPTAKAYAVEGYPTLFLLGPDGRIVAKGEDLRGEKLQATLERLLGN